MFQAIGFLAAIYGAFFFWDNKEIALLAKDVSFDSIINLVTAMIFVRVFYVIAVLILFVSMLCCVMLGHSDISVSIMGVTTVQRRLGSRSRGMR